MPTTPFTIRPARPADLPAICAIDAEAFAPYGTAEAPELFARRLAVHGAGFLVGERAGAVIAYACCERWSADRAPALDEDPALTHGSRGRNCCITGMAVRRDSRGQGCGMVLLDRLIELADDWGCEKIVLETTHAVGFYQRRGFGVVDTRRQSGVTLVVMERSLQRHS
jgi:ribosomal protein S18 acetylase RimI-like enzyme